MENKKSLQEDFTKSYTHTKPSPKNPRPEPPKSQSQNSQVSQTQQPKNIKKNE